MPYGLRLSSRDRCPSRILILELGGRGGQTSCWFMCEVFLHAGESLLRLLPQKTHSVRLDDELVG